jgi:nucleoside-diphosphate-sugar epimerase
MQTAWRPAVEKAVVSNKTFNGIVIRPGMVYGRSGSLTAMMFEEATKAAQNGQETFAWPATPGKRWMTIHQDDLAEFFLRVGEAVSVQDSLACTCNSSLIQHSMSRRR